MYQEQRLEEIIKLLEDRGSLSAKKWLTIFQFSQRKTSKINSWRFIANSKAKDSLIFKVEHEQSFRRKRENAHLATWGF